MRASRLVSRLPIEGGGTGSVKSNMAYPETADLETSSEAYAQRFAGETGAWFLKVQEEATLRMLAPYPEAAILEIGGGHGQLTGALVEHGYTITVFGSAEICKARVARWVDSRRCSFRAGDLLDLPYEEQTFDVAISYRLLPHVNRWERLLSEAMRVARHAVIVDYPEIRSVNYAAPFLFRFKKNVEGNTRPYTCFRESELLPVFRQGGFARADRFAEFFLPMVLHRKLEAPRLSMLLEKVFRLSGLTGLFGSPVILKMVRVGGRIA